jgi:hypothetical protein
MTDDDIYTLNNMARPLGFFVGRHRAFDPAMGGGQFYLMPKKQHPDERVKTLIKYKTFAEIEEFLQKAAAQYAA